MTTGVPSAPTAAATARAAGTARRSGQRSIARGSRAAGLLLIAPYLLALVAFGIYPTFYALYLSLVDIDGQFTGLANFTAAFTDYRFLEALRNVLVFMAIVIPMIMVLTLVISLILQARRGPLTSLTRLVVYLPGAFTGSASVLLWFFILDPELGPFSWLLSRLGLTYITDVVVDHRLPLIYALMTFTAAAGGWVVIMYGALNSVSNDVLEAARVDGANAWQRAVRIQIPMIKKYVIYMFILTFAGAAQIFTEPALFGSILQGSRFWSLNQLSLLLGIEEGKTGQSTAISLLLLVFGLVCALWLVLRTKFFDSDEA